MNFIDNKTDLRTLDFLSKSIDPEIMSKALDHSGLVQKQVQYKTKSGKIATRNQWVRANEEQHSEHIPKVEKPKREQRPATPWNVTEKIKHLVPVENLPEIPKFLKEIDKPIPPNWRNVRVSLDPNADILVIGKDDMDRPQYIYNKDYTERTTSEKFNRVRELMKHKDTVIAAISQLDDTDTADCLKLIIKMGIRPGSTRDTKAKTEALGATTLRGENVIEENGNVYLRFVGKKGVNQDHIVPDKDLAEMLVRRKEKSGDKGDLFDTSDVKLRRALKPLGIKPKDFRTMLATTTAQKELENIPPTIEPKEFIKIRNHIGDVVCELLGNQRKMALTAYIDPSVFKNWSAEGFSNWQNFEKEKKPNKEVA